MPKITKAVRKKLERLTLGKFDPKAPTFVINPELRHLAVPIKKLVLDPENARRHGDRNLDVVRKSLLRFGQYSPVIVQKEGMIVRVGNGRVMCAQALGWTHIAALVKDEDKLEAVDRAVTDNRSGELADWDYQGLGASIKWMRQKGVVMEDLGWTDEEVDAILLASPWEGQDDEKVKAGSESSNPATVIKIKILNKDNVDKYKASLERWAANRDGVEVL